MRVNNHGQWISALTGQQLGWPNGQAVVLDGTLLHREHTNRNFPSTHIVWRFSIAESAAINNNGDFIGLGSNFFPKSILIGRHSVFAREGETAPGFNPAMGVVINRFLAEVNPADRRSLSISDTSEVTFAALSYIPFVREHPTTFRGSHPIAGFGSALEGTVNGGFKASDNGRYLLVGKEDLTTGGFSPNIMDLGGLYPTFCNGDGGDQSGCTNCPCSNNAPSGTIGGCLNSANTSARLSATGNSSVSLMGDLDIDLRFSLVGAPPLSLCILKSGHAVAPVNAVNPCFGMNSGVPSMFYDGLRCSVTNTRRHGGRNATASGTVGLTNSAWGGDGGPPIGLAKAGGGFVSGQTRYFQVITRDDPLMVCGRGLNGSQAIEVAFTP